MPDQSVHSTQTICILGMHRSGTSCLAGSLEQVGVHLGDVIHKSPHNLRGNKENKTLRKINEDLLDFNGGSWDNLPMQMSWNRRFQARRDKHIAGFNNIPLWGFKDPRCLATLPFWREALGDIRLVATVRHPAQVARSLCNRPGLAPETEPFALWIDYNQRLLRLCQNEKVHLVCFDWPEAVYLGALKRLNSALGLPAPGKQVPFFAADLRSSDMVWPNVSHGIRSQAEDIYQALLSHALVDQKVH